MVTTSPPARAAAAVEPATDSSLLDDIISAALIFYVLTIGAVCRLRRTRPNVPRPYRAVGYPVVPALYIAGALTILVALFLYRAPTTWPGLMIVLLGLPVYLFWRRQRSERASRHGG
jgi:APA family basic amino acid/polyamine antiporter